MRWMIRLGVAMAMGLALAGCKTWQPCTDTTCTLCEGRGTYSCDQCGGDGSTGACSACADSQAPGRIRCQECQNGKLVNGVPCVTVSHKINQKNCQDCGGSGWTHAPGDHCPHCDGSTWRDCTTCGGDAKLGCKTCESDGQREHGQWVD